MSSKKTSSAQKPKRAKSKKNSTLSLIFGSSPFRILLATVLTFLTTLVAIWAIDSARFEGKVARNVSVSGYDVSGLSPTELSVVLQDISSTYSLTPVIIKTPDEEVETTAGAVGITIDPLASAELILQVGDGSLVTEPFRWIKSLFTDRSSNVVVYLSSGLNQELISTIVSEQPVPIEPKWKVEEGMVVSLPGIPAKAFNLDTIQDDVLEAARAGKNPIEVNVRTREIMPDLTDSEAKDFAQLVNDLTDDGLAVSVGSRTYNFTSQEIRDWLRFTLIEGRPNYEFDRFKITESINTALGGIVADSADEPELSVENGELKILNLSAKACCSSDSPDLIIDAINQSQRVVNLKLIDASDGTDELLSAYGVTELISKATTHHPCCASRVANIQRFAELMQGKVIRPGEAISLNNTVGERTEPKGFVEAGVIVNGELTEDVGGGISQFATTFFQASFYAGLEIEAYFPHTIWFQRYTDFAGRKGIESTISWPSPDVRVRNTTPYPVLIWPTWTHTSVSVSLYSTKYFEVEVAEQKFRMFEECEIIETVRRRTSPDQTETLDDFIARYQPENGIDCDGEPSYPRPPDAPIEVEADLNGDSITVSWENPEPEGDFDITDYFPIEEYIVTSDPGGETCSAMPPLTSCTFSGLEVGQPYTFSVIAINSEGESESSEPSNSVTPEPTPEPTPANGE